MTLFNNFIAAVVPYFPKFLIKPFAKPYVAGITLEEALEKARALNEQGFALTMDLLGEHVQSRTEAEAVRDAYINLLETISTEKLDSTISFKLTHLGLELDSDLARENTLTLAARAREAGVPITIDMENSPYTDTTIAIYRSTSAQYSGVGMVLQAYLFRSIADLKALDSAHYRTRICKGIYRESPEIAIQDRHEINGNFREMVQTLLQGQGYTEIATHDRGLIAELVAWIEANKIPLERFEFQVLLGVPMGNVLNDLLAKGYKVRVYLPYGAAWFDYSVRRLKENPDMAGYIIGNIFKRIKG